MSKALHWCHWMNLDQANLCYLEITGKSVGIKALGTGAPGTDKVLRFAQSLIRAIAYFEVKQC